MVENRRRQMWLQSSGEKWQENQRNKDKNGEDFPGGPVVTNLPSSAGNVGSIPGQGTKTPHAMGQISPDTAITEPTCSGAHTPTAKNPSTTTKTRNSRINKLYIYIFFNDKILKSTASKRYWWKHSKGHTGGTQQKRRKERITHIHIYIYTIIFCI